MARNGYTGLEMTGMAGHDLKQMEVTENDLRWLKCQEIAGNGQTWHEMAGNCWDGWKLLEIVGSG